MRKLYLALLMMSPATYAEVTAVSEMGFVSEHTVVLATDPLSAYQALTSRVHEWWDATHSFSGDAANFTLDARAGGCFCEMLDNGGSVQHMQVVFASPGKRLRMSGGLGPLQSMGIAGAMSFDLEPNESGGTTLRYRYEVGGFTAGGLKGLAGAVDQVQLGQLERLQEFLAQ